LLKTFKQVVLMSGTKDIIIIAALGVAAIYFLNRTFKANPENVEERQTGYTDRAALRQEGRTTRWGYTTDAVKEISSDLTGWIAGFSGGKNAVTSKQTSEAPKATATWFSPGIPLSERGRNLLTYGTSNIKYDQFGQGMSTQYTNAAAPKVTTKSGYSKYKNPYAGL